MPYDEWRKLRMSNNAEKELEARLARERGQYAAVPYVYQNDNVDESRKNQGNEEGEQDDRNRHRNITRTNTKAIKTINIKEVKCVSMAGELKLRIPKVHVNCIKTIKTITIKRVKAVPMTEGPELRTSDILTGNIRRI